MAFVDLTHIVLAIVLDANPLRLFWKLIGFVLHAVLIANQWLPKFDGFR